MPKSTHFPFLKNASAPDSLAVCGERALIRDLENWLGPVTSPSPAGMGDDCAIIEIPKGSRQILTTDSLSFGQHFDASIRPEEAGAKLIKRNLSDIAAMGGQPGPALLTLLCGPDLSIRWLESFVGGIRECCARYDVRIVGGDVSELSPGNFSASLAQTGTIEAAVKLRHTASIGDRIYVTGRLGGTLAGKHYRFTPRLREGRWLASRSECTAMMDLTDGLGKDLDALLPPTSSAAIALEAIPVSDAAKAAASESGRDPVTHAFSDGEDYELLFCCSAGSAAGGFDALWREHFPDLELHCLGEIIPDRGARYVDATHHQALNFRGGFEHFRPR